MNETEYLASLLPEPMREHIDHYTRIISERLVNEASQYAFETPDERDHWMMQRLIYLLYHERERYV